MTKQYRFTLTTAAILLLGVVWIGVSAASPGTTTSGAISAPKQGFQAPDFTLTARDGQTITLSDLRGSPVLVNVWASWCGPCRAEMPAMQRLYERYQGQGFVILAVNATNQDSQANALAFAQELGLTFPILWDTHGDVTKLYQVNAMPSSFFIDETGIIQEVVIGGPMAEALLITRVEQLLGEGR